MSSSSSSPVDDIPSAYICPISLCVMSDPVIDPDGITYDRSSIVDWLSRGNSVSPITRHSLLVSQLVPNRILREAIENFQKAKNAENVAAVKNSIENVKISPPAASDEKVQNDANGGVAVAVADGASSDPNVEIPKLSVNYLREISAIGVTITPAEIAYRPPQDILCVVDVSGSMGANVTLRDADNAVEHFALSQLDVVKHAIKTVVKGVNHNDRIGVITFSDTAKVIYPLTFMTNSNHSKCIEAVERMRVEGSTNIFAGIQMAIDVLMNDCALNEDRTFTNSSILLLTDGQPNINPPRGIIPTLERYLQQTPNKRKSINIHTFGFGYVLDSQMLSDIAVMGNGNFSFIPDSGLVGTVFVNTLANIMCGTGNAASVTLKVRRGRNSGGDNALVLDKEYIKSVYGVDVSVATNGCGDIKFPIDSLNVGQTKTFVFPLINDTQNGKSVDNAAVGVKVIDDDTDDIRVECELQFVSNIKKCNTTITATYPFNNVNVVVNGGQSQSQNVIIAPIATNVENDRYICAHARLRVVRAIFEWIKQKEANASAVISDSDIATLVDALNLYIAMLSKSDSADVTSDCRYITDLIKDVSDQVKQAITNGDYYSRWGKHYLRSLSRAHFTMTANNFKDPGVQHYGGQLFKGYRDVLDDIFISMPPPVAQQSSMRLSSTSAGHTGASAAAPSGASPRLANMSRFHNASSGCFAPSTRLLNGDGHFVRIGDLKVGDSVTSCDNDTNECKTTTIKMIVKYLIEKESIPVVEIERPMSDKSDDTYNPLVMTPYHPLKVNNTWAFPIDIITQNENVDVSKCSYNGTMRYNTSEEEAVYNLLLADTHTIIINNNNHSDVTPIVPNTHTLTTSTHIACTMSHGFTNNSVIAHPFFGTDNIVKSIAKYSEHEVSKGYYVLPSHIKYVRDDNTGYINDLVDTRF